MGAILFEDQTGSTPAADIPLESLRGSDTPAEPVRPAKPFPEPIVAGIGEEMQKKIIRYLDEQLGKLKTAHTDKANEWKIYEIAYRALPEAPKTRPFEGACNDVVPATAMAVDPIVARLDTGIFKQDPVFRLKALKKSVLPYVEPLAAWVDYVQRHQWKLRKVCSPRMNEFTKLGTMVLKTVYDRVEHEIKTYDAEWKPVKKKEVLYSGARVIGIPLDDLWLPPGYENIDDCHIVAERMRTTFGRLKRQERAGKMTNVSKIKAHTRQKDDADLKETRMEAANHVESGVPDYDDLEVFEVWFEFDVDEDDLPERMVAYFHRDSQTLLSLRYNWYFHQRSPYTIIPYTRANDSLYGVGLGEMTLPFQISLTRWHQMSQDNAYLANIRMYIAKANSPHIEQTPRLYAGRVFFVDDPSSDFKPFQAGEIYPSTLTERQNLFGLLEKRTGVSDYLTGRESPIVGSRATATSTVALIQEGTKRVEQVLENVREGLSDVLEKAFSIWIQYGLEGLDDIVFGDDETGRKVKEFFDMHSQRNVNGAIAVDLSASDASASRSVMQQVQLQIINVMMQYLEKLLQAGQGALAAQQQMPVYTEMVGEVMTAARKMFKDLLTKYDIKNADELLPDLEKFLDGTRNSQPVGAAGPTVSGGATGSPAGPGGATGVEGMGPGTPVPGGAPRAGGPILPGFA